MNIGTDEKIKLSRLNELFVPKRNAKCLVDVTGRTCSGPIIRGHTIPKSWFKRIATKGDLYNLRPSKLDFIRPILDGKVPQYQPVKEHQNMALTQYFTCREHDARKFQVIENANPDFTNPATLHVLLLKAILAQEWELFRMQNAYGKFSQEFTDPNAVFMRDMNVQARKILQPYKHVVSECSQTGGCVNCRDANECNRIRHYTRDMRGEARLAAYEFSNPLPGVSSDGHIQKNAGVGISLIPTNYGHTFVYSYFADEGHMIERELSHIKELNSRKFEEYVSHMILGSCEFIAFSPSYWEREEFKNQRVIINYWNQTLIELAEEKLMGQGNFDAMQDPIVAMRHPRQLNLFKRLRR